MTTPGLTHATPATTPDPVSFAVVAGLSGHALTAELVAGAAAAHAAMADATAAMRAVPLALVDAIEPAHVLQRLRGPLSPPLPAPSLSPPASPSLPPPAS